MPQRTTRQMEYRTQGSAAMRPAYAPEEFPETPKPAKKQKPRTARKPAHRPAPKPAQRAKMELAPFTVAGGVLSVVMLLLVLFGYTQVYESAKDLGHAEDSYQMLLEENQRLQNTYDSSIDLKHIESRAKELGMQRPSPKQMIRLQIPEEDVAVVTDKTPSNPLRLAWEAIVDTAETLWSYLRGN